MKLFRPTDAIVLALFVTDTINLFATGNVDRTILAYLIAGQLLTISILLEKGTKP